MTHVTDPVAVSVAPQVPDKRVGALSAGLAVLRYLTRTGTRAGVSRIARDVQLKIGRASCRERV